LIISQTPFRISFFGGGTDFPAWYLKNGGAVLSSTIDKYVYISARVLPPFFSMKHRIVWSKVENVKSYKNIEHPVIRAGLKHLGVEDKFGLDLHYQSDLPARTGMGSSSAFTVGFINSIMTLNKKKLSSKKLAEEAINIEQKILKETVGCQDQYACAYGGFNQFEFCESGKINVTPIRVSKRKIKLLESNLLLIYLGVERFGSDIAKKVVSSLEKKRKNLDNMRKMVYKGITILTRNESIEDFGDLLNEAWINKKALNPIISNSKIDYVYDLSMKNGALGGKLLGAGKTGFMILFVPKEKKEKLKAVLKDFLIVPFRFSFGGSQIIYNES
tara:strand:+ start:3747 stop:4736 length:990 start_codon:yes stop_codon:yes gene_type:complete